MTRNEAWDAFLRAEKQEFQAHLSREADCVQCVRASMAYCLQCEVKDINQQTEA